MKSIWLPLCFIRRFRNTASSRTSTPRFRQDRTEQNEIHKIKPPTNCISQLVSSARCSVLHKITHRISPSHFTIHSQNTPETPPPTVHSNHKLSLFHTTPSPEHALQMRPRQRKKKHVHAYLHRHRAPSTPTVPPLLHFPHSPNPSHIDFNRPTPYTYIPLRRPARYTIRTWNLDTYEASQTHTVSNA